MKDRNFAEEFAREAGEILLSWRDKPTLDVNFKSDSSLVTDADLAADRSIIANIRREFPEDVIFTEESGISSDQRSEGIGIWVVDPLDGTTNFANGYDFFCVSVARGKFTADGKIDVFESAIFAPVTGNSWTAKKGMGAFKNGQTIRVKPERPFDQNFLVTGFYYMKDEELEHEIRRFARVAKQCQSIRRDGSAALDLALVADGTFDGFWEIGLQPWDVAAGQLIVSEAGGVVRNYQIDGDFDVETPGIITGQPATVSTLADLLGLQT